MRKKKPRMIEIKLKNGLRIHGVADSIVYLSRPGGQMYTNCGSIHNGYWTYADLSGISWSEHRQPIPRVFLKLARKLGFRWVRIPYRKIVFKAKGKTELLTYGYAPVKKLMRLQGKRRSIVGFGDAVFVLYKKSDFVVRGD